MLEAMLYLRGNVGSVPRFPSSHPCLCPLQCARFAVCSVHTTDTVNVIFTLILIEFGVWRDKCKDIQKSKLRTNRERNVDNVWQAFDVNASTSIVRLLRDLTKNQMKTLVRVPLGSIQRLFLGNRNQFAEVDIEAGYIRPWASDIKHEHVYFAKLRHDDVFVGFCLMMGLYRARPQQCR